MKRLRIPNEIVGLVRGLHPHLKKKLKAALLAIIEDPLCGKALHEELASLRSLRVSRFRIIYRMGGAEEIHIVAIGPRRTIYEETARIIRQKGTDSA